MAKFSRDKGRRGEQEIASLLHGKRTGIAGVVTQIDVATKFADYQVKNCNLNGTQILEALEALIKESDSKKAQYVIFKPARGKWLVVETLTQHMEHHNG